MSLGLPPSRGTAPAVDVVLPPSISPTFSISLYIYLSLHDTPPVPDLAAGLLSCVAVAAEATNSRVMMYSGFSIGVLLIVAIWQVYHLQNYLKSVKLL